MSDKPCPCTKIGWIWGDFIKCLDCGRRYNSPDEAEALKQAEDAMGMFDDVASDAMRCPLCGNAVAWQSKDGPCTLETLTVHELMEQTNFPTFYTSCPECRVSIEVSVRRETGKTEAQWLQFRKERAIIKERKGIEP